MNPSLLFNRITSVLNSTEMEAFLAHQLAPQLPSLFEGGQMRKPPKSKFLRSSTESVHKAIRLAALATELPLRGRRWVPTSTCNLV